MTPDAINGTFELIGAVLMSMDIVRIYRDKEVSGVWWPARLFFLLWGVWNIYFYSYYDHFWSWIGGLAMTGVNAVWVCFVLYYEMAWKWLPDKCEIKGCPRTGVRGNENYLMIGGQQIDEMRYAPLYGVTLCDDCHACYLEGHILVTRNGHEVRK